VTADVAAVRRSYEAFEAGDREGALALMDDSVEWHQAEGLPHGGVYHGVAAVRAAVFDPLDEEWWDDFHALPSEFIACGEHVVVLGRYSGRAKSNGTVLDVPFAHIWQFRRGRAVRFLQFTDTLGWTNALQNA
jgi:ketosteroid isomerase-like protein